MAADPLTQLVYSDHYPDRVRAGLVVERLVAPGVSLKRRVENVRLVASNVNERSVELDVDLSAAARMAQQVDVALDCVVLSLVPKALMSGFEIKASDSALQSAAQRATDSRMAQCLLVVLAMSREEGLPGLPLPSANIWRLLYEHCFRFPIEFDPYKDLAHSIELGLSLKDEDRNWWVTACMSDAWREWLLRLGDLFLIVTEAQPATGLQKFTFARRSGRDPVKNPGVAKALLKPAHPATPLAIRLYDLGHAQSEHVHLHAAEGTFLSGGFLVTRRLQPTPGLGKDVWQQELLAYRRRPTRHEVTVYLEGAAPGNSLLLANLWPETRAFVTPVRYISYWVTIIPLLAAILTYFDLLKELRAAADATLMMMYLLPTLAIGFLLQPDRQPEIRWRMLAWTRQYALILLAISVPLSLLWLIKPTDQNRWYIIALDIVGSIGAAFITWRASKTTQPILAASRMAKADEEAGPPRGYRASLTVMRR